jgi:hypothetical protein
MSFDKYSASARASCGSVFFHRLADHFELVRVDHYHACHLRHYRVVKQPRIACDLHRDFVARPQLLDELPQILQLPFGHIRSFVLQPDATREPVAV